MALDREALDRETLTEVVVAAVGVGAFFAAVIVIGVLYAEDGLGSQGGLALVGAIVGFILLMSVLGVGLTRYRDRE